LLGWDASVADSGGAALNPTAWNAVGFRAGQNRRRLTVKSGKPFADHTLATTRTGRWKWIRPTCSDVTGWSNCS